MAGQRGMIRSLRALRIAGGLVLSAMLLGPAGAQDFPVEFLRTMALRDQPPEQALASIEGYAPYAGLDAAGRTRIDTLVAAAHGALDGQDQARARRALAEARAVLTGASWSDEQAFASSIGIGTDSPFVTSGGTMRLALAPLYPAPAKRANLRVSIVRPGTAPIVLGERPLVLRLGGTTTLDLPVPAGLDGRGTVLAEVIVAGKPLATTTLRADFVPDLAALERDTEARLARVEASEDARAVVRYPFALARAVASGAREMEARPFADRLARSRSVLAALEQGRDIVHRGTGDQDRAYIFAETGELIPYRIYVPSDWDGKESLPLILALHGAGGDENGMMQVDGSKFQKLAERYRYIVVSPLGYRPLGAYGSPIRLPSVYGSNIAEGRAIGGPERARLLARSERDTLDILERTIAEYGADRSRIFLTGHSMGGGGTWYLAHQHPELWRAIAPSAGPFLIDGYDFERLRRLAIMIVQGGGDPPSLKADRQLAIDLLGRGFGVNYLETPSVNHGHTFGASLPTIFEFFERQKLKEHPELPLKLPDER